MYPYTHAHATREITHRTDRLLLYGSILPDISLTRILNGEEINKRAEEFRNWLLENEPTHKDLGLGMMLHELPCGINRFARTAYKGKTGYTHQLANHLEKEIHCTPEESNNLIELGVEFHIITDHPDIVSLLRTAVESMPTPKISKYFSHYYGTDMKQTENAITSFNNLLTGHDYTSIQGLTLMWILLSAQLFGKQLNHHQAKVEVEKSVAITRDSYKKFMADAIRECREDVKKYL